MSDIVLVAIIALCGVIVTVFGAILPLFINRWFKKMDDKLDKYHETVNGNMQKLLDVTGAAAKAEGNLEGRADLKQEQIDDKTSATDTPAEVKVVNEEPISVKNVQSDKPKK